MGRKLSRPILYRASNGQFATLDPQVLQNEFQIRFAAGSGLVSTRDQKKQELFTLFQAGAIDAPALLEGFDVKDRDAVIDIVRGRIGALLAEAPV